MISGDTMMSQSLMCCPIASLMLSFDDPIQKILFWELSIKQQTVTRKNAPLALHSAMLSKKKVISVIEMLAYLVVPACLLNILVTAVQ